MKMLERLDEKCKGCKYDKNKDGAYFCLCCTLIGEFTPHIKTENENGKAND